MLFTLAHIVLTDYRDAPHFSQNHTPCGFFVPQNEQITGTTSRIVSFSMIVGEGALDVGLLDNPYMNIMIRHLCFV